MIYMICEARHLAGVPIYFYLQLNIKLLQLRH